jgi:OOP family OmpA-OmpF porin
MRLSRYCRWASSVGLVIVMTPALADAQGVSQTYTDSRGKKIVFPLGDASFADEIVSFDLGKPAPRDQRWLDAKVALGPPDYNPKTESTKTSDVVLGCAGTLVVHFNDNALVDVPGPDLYVFEVGPRIEGVLLAISPDGITWTEAGNISGGTAEVDIAKVAKPDEGYRYTSE